VASLYNILLGVSTSSKAVLTVKLERMLGLHIVWVEVQLEILCEDPTTVFCLFLDCVQLSFGTKRYRLIESPMKYHSQIQ
jgi:hypothetical protein